MSVSRYTRLYRDRRSLNGRGFVSRYTLLYRDIGVEVWPWVVSRHRVPGPAIRATCAWGRATTRRGMPSTRPLGLTTRPTTVPRYGATTRHDMAQCERAAPILGAPGRAGWAGCAPVHPTSF